MKREDIEKAAAQISFIETPDARERFLLRSGFKAGAKWRIDSVWHDIKESPKQGSLIAVFDGEDMHLWRAEDIENVIDGRIKVVSITLKECFIRQHIIRWAYIEDLIPTKED